MQWATPAAARLPCKRAHSAGWTRPRSEGDDRVWRPSHLVQKAVHLLAAVDDGLHPPELRGRDLLDVRARDGLVDGRRLADEVPLLLGVL
jgi:hypothetical protein